MRPRSIMLFERIYGFNILLGIASGAWAWMHWTAMLPPGMPPQVATMMPIIMASSLIGGTIINLLLLFFIARKGAEIAKWIFIVLFVVGVVGVLRGFAGSAVQLPAVTRVFAIVQIVIQAACAWLLFRPDTVPWFRGEPVPPNLRDTFS
ncbi:hypothetical protein HZF05_09230 [Sphingomonas sp. CGMCC 1.13654]|uniref:Uncharacterized protein n=1 Tax=Sphingomonas chungangi TaxID=2683589 RepID=A0A838L4I6_9SPHN|nr:hypothetical protein [Sphingomonas chungangi]MBA2934281.1 hypothetical protein [Sphingomonas chungangi]MVW57322.1 hypothetical protein [Sphingomonas chungangi]